MGDVDQLKEVFDENWDWSTQGDEWSTWWGGTPALWFGGILPRIHVFVPTGTILEIAPGFGRWTQYLKDMGSRVILVDLAAKCIEACRQRFADETHLEFHVNDGKSLDMVADGSVDFAYSWDSLVHADAEIIEAYVQQLAKKLSPNGVAWIHHSNVEGRSLSHRLAVRTPEKVRRRLVARGAMLDVYAWRSPTVSAELVAQMCERAGVVCISQEEFSWEHGPFMTEAITVFTPRGSRWARPRRHVRTRSFRSEARRMAKLYAQTSFPNVTA